MKVRHGFVSNSSTSSFLIYGVHLESDTAKEICSGDDLCSDPVEYFESLFNENKLNLSVHSQDAQYGGVYIGRSWSNVGDNETGKDFKNRTESDILKILNGKCKNVKFGTHKHAWYDG